MIFRLDKITEQLGFLIIYLFFLHFLTFLKAFQRPIITKDINKLKKLK